MRGKELISALSDDQILSKFWEADLLQLAEKNPPGGCFLLTFIYTGQKFSSDKGMEIKISLMPSTLVPKGFLLSTPLKNINWY